MVLQLKNNCPYWDSNPTLLACELQALTITPQEHLDKLSTIETIQTLQSDVFCFIYKVFGDIKI